jgi:hypothetical protein
VTGISYLPNLFNMKRITLLLLLVTSILSANAQLIRTPTADSVVVGARTGLSGTNLTGRVYLPHTPVGSGTDSILTILNRGVRKVAALPISKITGLQDSLTNKYSKSDANTRFITPTSTNTLTNKTWQGVAIGDTYISSATTWNAKESALTFNTGLTRTSNTVKVDTTAIQTVLNFFPKGDTRYYTKTAADAKYEVPLTFSSPLVRSTNTISIPLATSSVNGYLSSADRTNFQSAYTYSQVGHLPLAGGSVTGKITITTATTGALEVVKNSSTDNRFIRLNNSLSGGKVIDFVNTGASTSGLFGLYNHSDGLFLSTWDETTGAMSISNLGGSGNVIAYANNTGLIGKMAIGSGLSFSGGTLSATGGSAGTVTGSGTSGKLVKWNSASDIGDATSLTISGSDLSVAGTMTATNFIGAGTSLTGTASSLSIGGTAATATALQNARTINGVSFDGTANITVPAAAGTLTGATLASGVTASSLTSVGTLTSLATGALTGTSAIFTDALTLRRVTSTDRFKLFIGDGTTGISDDTYIRNLNTDMHIMGGGAGTTEIARFATSGATTLYGNVTASNLSGTNTGDQTITLTGAVTGSGTGSFATTLASGIDATKLADGTVTSAELQYINSLSSNAQTQLNAKEGTLTAGTTSQYYRGDKSWQTLDKTAVGLSNVDNTTDANKPVSTATQTALNLKANLASPTFTGTVSGITKSMVGLSSVDNTSDAGKPVSTAQQTALDLKEDLSNKSTSTSLGTSNTLYPTQNAVKTYVDNALPVVTSGTWTPASIGGSSPAFSASEGKWFRNGNLVHAFFKITFPVSAASIDIEVNGLPFDAKDDLGTMNTSFNQIGVAVNGETITGIPNFFIRNAATGAKITFAGASGQAVDGVVIYELE